MTSSIDIPLTQGFLKHAKRGLGSVCGQKNIYSLYNYHFIEENVITIIIIILRPFSKTKKYDK